jgi:hypothetical protein
MRERSVVRKMCGAWSVGSVVGLAGLVAAGCGGGSTSPGAQFCQSWASAFCQKLYACTPANMRGADFLGGSSESQCTSLWDQTCAAPAPAGTTFDVNCSGGARVNTAAKTACLNELATISCDDFNAPTYQSVCDQVCAENDGGAGSGGTSNGGTGAGGEGAAGAAGTAGGVDAGAPTDSLTFCEALNRQTCELAFSCVPTTSLDTTFIGTFGSSLAECQGSKTQAICANATCMPSYQPTAGSSCIAIYSLYTCDDVANGLPADCTQACPTPGNGGAGGGGTGGGGAGPGGAGGGAGTGGASGGHTGTGGTSGSGGAGGTGGVSNGTNLIVNGDFSNGLAGWGVTVQAGSLGSQTISDGQLCMGLGVYTTVTLGFPSDISGAFALTSGANYQISYQASTTVSTGQFEVKVGSDVPPYTQTDFLTDSDVPGSSPLTFTHLFTSATSDPQAGLAFNIVSGTASSTTVCVSHVSLVASD